EARANQEFPLTWEQALAGGGELYFPSRDVDYAGRDHNPVSRKREPGRRYHIGWDIGTVDASVGTVLDISEDVYDVADQVVLRGASYAEIKHAIERLHARY